jgi:acetylornithine deacetylase
MKIHTGPWGTAEPMATANTCKVELFWQTMPGEDLALIDEQFHGWLHQVIEARPDLFPAMPKVEFPIRWLPGSSVGATDFDQFFIQQLSAAASEVLGVPPAVGGIEGPCDMYVFHQYFGIPAVLWGASGANTHLADEYVEIESVISAAKALLLFVHRWGRFPRFR